jgi:hypothetical protein
MLDAKKCSNLAERDGFEPSDDLVNGTAERVGGFANAAPPSVVSASFR